MPIHAFETEWVIETRTTAYALGINQAGLLAHRYWGPRLPAPNDYPPAPNPLGWASFNNPAQLTPEEYPTYEDMKFTEPCLMVRFADGGRNLVLRFQRAEVVGNELRITMRDIAEPCSVTLHYRAHEQYDLIERWVSATNAGTTPITIERIWSAQWHV
ncbi:MAG: hypothetical protein JST60_09910, partial [Chloroflexi bacterium SZAS-1]|nr:hypothetical protein [Chloroflexi bacterium SZAS-1]